MTCEYRCKFFQSKSTKDEEESKLKWKTKTVTRKQKTNLKQQKKNDLKHTWYIVCQAIISLLHKQS